jgi:hypothetical protein
MSLGVHSGAGVRRSLLNLELLEFGGYWRMTGGECSKMEISTAKLLLCKRSLSFQNRPPIV